MHGSRSSSQRGMALAISLIFLAIITLLSFTSMQDAIIQNRMASNQRDYTMALQAAESALHDAENRLENDGAATNIWTTHNTNIAQLSRSPRYFIQPLTQIGSRSNNSGAELVEMLYRIEAQGFGVAKETSVTLEALYVREQSVEVPLP